jgi:predicted MFS family arabinose efflux permease
MFMEAPAYWLMCVARALQGVASSVVWIVGLAMLCDTTPEKHLGRTRISSHLPNLVH